MSCNEKFELAADDDDVMTWDEFVTVEVTVPELTATAPLHPETR